jgi:hypothetical protein
LDLLKNLNEAYDMKDMAQYNLLAEMFRYPSDDLKTYSVTWRELISSFDPQLNRKLDPFIAHINENPYPFNRSTISVPSMYRQCVFWI